MPTKKPAEKTTTNSSKKSSKTTRKTSAKPRIRGEVENLPLSVKLVLLSSAVGMVTKADDQGFVRQMPDGTLTLTFAVMRDGTTFEKAKKDRKLIPRELPFYGPAAEATNG